MNETNLNFLSPCIINSHFKTSEIYFVKVKTLLLKMKKGGMCLQECLRPAICNTL